MKRRAFIQKMFFNAQAMLLMGFVDPRVLLASSTMGCGFKTLIDPPIVRCVPVKRKDMKWAFNGVTTDKT
ncbi:MAG: hypothetical protein JRI82_16940 [Deltaproteobacteria bacterium]|nr:hypothetical protein [Deltaproteobacteria bacterium]